MAYLFEKKEKRKVVRVFIWYAKESNYVWIYSGFINPITLGFLVDESPSLSDFLFLVFLDTDLIVCICFPNSLSDSLLAFSIFSSRSKRWLFSSSSTFA